MSQWGVFRDDRDGALHVAPVLEDGRLGLRHQLTQFCPCSPRLDDDKAVELWVHQDPECGGYDS